MHPSPPPCKCQYWNLKGIQFGRRRRRRQDNIKIEVREVGCKREINWTVLVFVNTALLQIWWWNVRPHNRISRSVQGAPYTVVLQENWAYFSNAPILEIIDISLIIIWGLSLTVFFPYLPKSASRICSTVVYTRSCYRKIRHGIISSAGCCTKKYNFCNWHYSLSRKVDSHQAGQEIPPSFFCNP
jgi:hypothetical protein